MQRADRTRPATRTIGLIAALLLGGLGLAQPAQAGRLFLSTLDGAQEVPPVPSPGSGEAVTYLHTDETTARIYLKVEGLENTIVAAHIHLGAPGTNGPMIYDLGAFSDSLATDFGPIGPGILPSFLNGDLYVNVHTDVYLDGEIRGQLVPQASLSFTATLDGSSEVPPNDSEGTGFADLTLWPDGSRLHLDLRVDDLHNEITASHIHRGVPGENGPVVFTIGPFAERAVRDFTPSPEEVLDLRAGLHYVNVHTGPFPGGEIRGQIGENTPALVDPAPAPRARLALVAEPNPVREGVTLRWARRADGGVDPARVEILDASGRRVRLLAPAGGTQEVRWDGRAESGLRAAAGVYFARLSRGAESATLPLTVIR